MIFVRDVGGSLAELAAAANRIEDDMRAAGVATWGARMLALVLDELGSNTIRHGGASRLEVHIDISGDTAIVELRDDGSTFDPRGTRVEADSAAKRRNAAGGRGLQLVKNLAAITNYSRKQGLNRLTLQMPMTRPEA